MMSPDCPPPPLAPVARRMLPDDPLNEDPDEMETPPLDALLATPDEMMTPPDPVIPIPSLDTMAIPGVPPLESGVDPNPPPQHCTVESDVTAHTPYHPQLMDVMTPRDEAAYGTAVAPRRDDPARETAAEVAARTHLGVPARHCGGGHSEQPITARPPTRRKGSSAQTRPPSARVGPAARDGGLWTHPRRQRGRDPRPSLTTEVTTPARNRATPRTHETPVVRTQRHAGSGTGG